MLVDSKRSKGVGSAAGTLGKLGKGDVPLLAVLSNPEHRQLVGVAGPFSDYVDSEVKIFWHFKVETTTFGLIISHMRGSGYDHMQTPSKIGRKRYTMALFGYYFCVSYHVKCDKCSPNTLPQGALCYTTFFCNP